MKIFLLVVTLDKCQLSNVYCSNDGCQVEGPLKNTEQEAIAAWNELPRALEWTSDPPEVSGWYFWEIITEDQEEVVQSFFFDMYFDVIDDFEGGLWAGPIPEPKGNKA